MNNYRSFQGDLSLLSAANLFQLIGQATLSGKLVILSSNITSNFFFAKGKLNYGFCCADHKKIGQILVESQLITAQQLDICLTTQNASSQSQKLGSIAVAKGFLQHSQILDFLYNQTEKAIFQTLSWTDGRFNFMDNSPLKDKDIVLEENINSLVLKGLIYLDHNTVTNKH